MLARLREKEHQARTALNLALNVSLQAVLTSPQASVAQTQPEQSPLAAISPGQKYTVRVKFHNGSAQPLHLRSLALEDQSRDKSPPYHPGRTTKPIFRFKCRPTPVPTRPAFHRNDPERDAVYAVDEPQYQTMPFPPPPLRVIAQYSVTNLGSRTSDELRGTTHALTIRNFNASNGDFCR